MAHKRDFESGRAQQRRRFGVPHDMPHVVGRMRGAAALKSGASLHDKDARHTNGLMYASSGKNTEVFPPPLY